MPEGFASAGGVRIHYSDHGGDGPPLVAVHATGFHGRVWDPWVSSLSERFRVVTLDQRGHGDSDKPESGYEWTRFGEDVLAVCDALGLERPRGFGHSAGAAALVFAETSRPGTFSRLVLMDPVTPHPDIRRFMTDANPLAEGARRRRRVWEGTEQMIARLTERGPLATWREEFLRAYVEHGTRPHPEGVELKCPPEVEAQVYEMGGRHDGWERLAKLGCPTMLLCGQDSDLWPAGRREEAADRISDGRLVVVEGTHFYPMENPKGTLEHLLGFLSEER